MSANVANAAHLLGQALTDGTSQLLKYKGADGAWHLAGTVAYDDNEWAWSRPDGSNGHSSNLLLVAAAVVDGLPEPEYTPL